MATGSGLKRGLGFWIMVPRGAAAQGGAGGQRNKQIKEARC